MVKNVPSLAEVIDILREIAPLELAADWDNTGLLVEPRAGRRRVARVLLCIDLTAAVVAEARAQKCDLVVAYHPPIFQGLKKVLASDGRQNVVAQVLAADVAVYSPHTALDAAPGGLAEWLAETVLGGEAPKELRACGEGEFGRVVEPVKPLPFRTLLQRIKTAFGLKLLQVARPARAKSSVRSIGVAAGAGGSVLRGSGAEVWVTGELAHHDALAAVANGTSVVLAGHSRTERPYLRILQKRLARAFDGDVDVRISRADADPWQLL